jgi:hypothetical protein
MNSFFIANAILLNSSQVTFLITDKKRSLALRLGWDYHFGIDLIFVSLIRDSRATRLFKRCLTTLLTPRCFVSMISSTCRLPFRNRSSLSVVLHIMQRKIYIAQGRLRTGAGLSSLFDLSVFHKNRSEQRRSEE